MIPPALLAFVRASSFHIGAAAAAASLRKDLVKDHGVDPREIDAAYAVSRITPGTNLLALYALLGHRLGGWPFGVEGRARWSFVPALLVLVVAIVYTESESPFLAALMAGARAGGIAVFLGAAIRLLRPQLDGRLTLGLAFAAISFLIVWIFPVNLFVMLLLAAAGGAFLLRPHE